MTHELARVIALATRRGACVRLVDRETYGLGAAPAGHEDLDGMCWDNITRNERRVIIADRMKAARRRGIVNERGGAVWRQLPTRELRGAR